MSDLKPGTLAVTITKFEFSGGELVNVEYDVELSSDFEVYQEVTDHKILERLEDYGCEAILDGVSYRKIDIGWGVREDNPGIPDSLAESINEELMSLGSISLTEPTIFAWDYLRDGVWETLGVIDND